MHMVIWWLTVRVSENVYK